MRTAGTLSAIDTTALAAELRRRRSVLPRLERKRDRIAAKVAALDAEIERLGGKANGAARGGARPRNAEPLAAVLAKVLKGKTLSVGEAADAARKAGYRSGGASFVRLVNAAMLRDARFKRVKRGRYTAK